MDEKDNPRSKQYDHSWDDDDFDEDEEELDEDEEDPFERKMEQWEKRDWQKWLKQYLTFPFTAIREEDEEDMDANPFSSEGRKPFAVGSKMIVFEFGYDDFHEAVLAHVKQGNQKGSVPLADLKVTPKSDPNYWAVREYVVWSANQ